MVIWSSISVYIYIYIYGTFIDISYGNICYILGMYRSCVTIFVNGADVTLK